MGAGHRFQVKPGQPGFQPVDADEKGLSRRPQLLDHAGHQGAGPLLLSLRHRVFQVQDQGVRAVLVGLAHPVFPVAGDEHHRPQGFGFEPHVSLADSLCRRIVSRALTYWNGGPLPAKRPPGPWRPAGSLPGFGPKVTGVGYSFPSNRIIPAFRSIRLPGQSARRRFPRARSLQQFPGEPW